MITNQIAIGEQMTNGENVDNEEESLLKNENSGGEDDAKINYRGWKVMPFIIGNEIFEKLGAIGTLSNLLVYLTTEPFPLMPFLVATRHWHSAPWLPFWVCFLILTQILGKRGSIASSLALMLLSSVIFFSGAKMYVKVKPSGSPITSIVQVIVVAAKKRKHKLPEYLYPSLFNYVPPKSMNSKLPYTYQFRFLDKAAIITPQDQKNPNGSAADPWNLCSMQQVEEVKCLLRVLPIWASAVLYYVVIVQQHTILVFQALLSDRRIGQSKFMIPGASYYVFLMISVAIWLPIYDRKVVPFLQRITRKEGGITLLQRMGIGIFLGILSMLVSAIVEEHRRTLALTKPLDVETRKGAISSMSGLWLIPQLALAGLAEAFMSVAQIEFYYKQFPENMRSIAGSWLPEDLNKGRLDNFYLIIAAVQIVNLGCFVICAQWYRYKETDNSSIELDKVTKQSEKSGNDLSL
ncbi:unnamed protein product [Vicia faba]|uniref:Uncharacterized protein n=1 Tax=Vicia faba TaxID=3906 RepID=A0AAV1AKU1_VICFA|nr:unnamed protein product [Vicia faba]